MKGELISMSGTENYICQVYIAELLFLFITSFICHNKIPNRILLIYFFLLGASIKDIIIYWIGNR